MEEDGPGRFPGDRRESQPTVIASGKPRELLQRVPLRLFGERASPGDGAVIATTRDDPAFVARRLTESVDAFDSDRMALVDCCTKQRGAPERSERLRWDVPSPVAFSDISAAIRDALDELAELGCDRSHFLFDTLTTQFRLADAEHVLRHTNDVAITVGADAGLAVFTVDRSAITDREFEQLKHFFDVDVEVRRGDDRPEVRWSGLVGNSDGWVTLADSGIRFDAIGNRIS